MATLGGWAIIAVAFGSISMALLWAPYRLLRRSRANSRALRWAYAAAIAACSLGLWYAIPLMVHKLFGHATH